MVSLISAITGLETSGKVLLVEKYYYIVTSSIKIKNHTKSELDKLQAEILVKYDMKLTQQDLIELLLQIGKENIHDHFTQVPMKQKKKGLMKMLEKSSSWGIETQEDMIDEVLYGAKES